MVEDMEVPQQQPLLPLPEAPVASRVARIEKNLNSLGFFSPTASTSKRGMEKVVKFVRELPGGVKAESKATILGTSRGLPTTADLDKYIAFQLIVSELKKRHGSVSNPIGFTTYQLLRLLGLKPTGKRYAEVDQWLDRMAGTLVKSEGAVYFAKTKRYMRDRFHVFDKVYTVGQELPDGGKAEQNYVFLSEWQLENLNHGHVLPVALEHYQRLRSDIAKNLVPLLYIWFYASKRPIQKRYQDLCQQLNIKTWTQLSRVNEQFSPVFKELESVGYIAAWEISRTVDALDFKLSFSAGRIFRQERVPDVRQRDDREHGILDSRFSVHLKMLTDRNVNEKIARRLLFGISDDVNVEEQIEWVDSIIERDPRKFDNPPGLYVSFLRDGILPPRDFVSSRRRKELADFEAERRNSEALEAAKQWDADERYAEYREEQARTYIESLSEEAKLRLSKDARRSAVKAVPNFDVLTRDQQQDITGRFAFKLVLDELPILNREEFLTRQDVRQLLLPSSQGR